MDIRRALEYAIVHRRWVGPLVWLGIIALPVAGAGWWGGFDPVALPWIAGILAFWGAGFLGGLVCVAKRRRVGWSGVVGWLIVPLFHFGSGALGLGEGWAPTFVADVMAILIALVAAGTSISASWLPARPGSMWGRVTGETTAEASLTSVGASRVGSTIGAAIVVCAAIATGACGSTTDGGGSSTTHPAITTSTSTTRPTTTAPPTSTTTSSSSTTQAPAPLDLPPLLVADATGVRLIDDGTVTVFVEGTAVDFAVPDLTGGVIYVGPDTDSWHWGWDGVTGTGVMIPDEPGGGPSPISWISEPGVDPVVLVEPTGFLWLEQVTQLGGHPTLIYRAQVPERIECNQGPDECAWYSIIDHLFALDLVSRDLVDLGGIGSFESSFIGIRFSQELLVVTTGEYGSSDGCGAVFPRSVLVPSDIGAWIGEGGVLWRTCEFGPKVECESGDPVSCGGSFAAAIAPDGATVAYVQAIEAWNTAAARPAELVLIDAATRAPIRRVEIGPARIATSWLEWDGTYALVGRYDTTVLGGSEDQLVPPVLVMPDGTVHELDRTARYALWTPGD